MNFELSMNRFTITAIYIKVSGISFHGLIYSGKIYIHLLFNDTKISYKELFKTENVSV
jgi:hypothetical protein